MPPLAGKGHISRTLFIACVALGASVMASAALAGECPSDQKNPNARQPVEVKHAGVTDTVIAMIDLEKEPVNIKDRKFRVRRLTIKTGGTVPWHSHADRPDFIYIIEGEINEYASNCAVPIIHKAGDTIAETHEVSHWWKNLGDETVILISVDLAKDPSAKDM